MPRACTHNEVQYLYLLCPPCRAPSLNSHDLCHDDATCAGITNACTQCTEINIPKRDLHTCTYIHTYRHKTR